MSDLSDLKIYVISMPEAKDRQERTIKRLKELNVDFQFIDGVDGRDLDVSTVELYRQKTRRYFFGKEMMGTELGCFMAHMNVYKQAISDNAKYVLILEDDVDIKDDFFPVIDEILQSGFSFETIRFLGHPKTIKKGCREVKKIGKYALGRIKSSPGGGYAYMFTNHGVKKYLKYIEDNGTYLPIDTLLAFQWKNKLDGYVMLSNLAESNEDLTISYIGSDRFDKGKDLNRPNFFIFTRVYFKISSAIEKSILYYSRFIKSLYSSSR